MTIVKRSEVSSTRLRRSSSTLVNAGNSTDAATTERLMMISSGNRMPSE